MDEIGEVNPSHSIGTKNTHRRWGGREVLSKFELMKVRGGTQCSPSTDLTGLALDADGETVGPCPLEECDDLMVEVVRERRTGLARVRFSLRSVR